jgi:hypothetical protein
MQSSRIQAGRQTGSPFVAGPYTVTPEALVFSACWSNYGFFWNLPVALTVNRAERSQRVVIVDATRLIVWALWLLTVWAGLAGVLALLKPRRRKNG